MRYLILVVCAATMFISAAATAQVGSRGYNIYRACTSLGELADGLDRVVNEQQILNNSQDIFRSTIGCFLRSPREVVAFQPVGWYLTEPRDRSEPRFWVMIHHVTYRNGFKAVRPDNIYRASRWELPRRCRRQFTDGTSRNRVVRIYGTRDHRPLPGCDRLQGRIR